ncbi:hypothetical protein N806_29485 [Rhodococcus sp. P27]|nr:hypothetical protein N806_29485 [Rhodococcus sp. P27]
MAVCASRARLTDSPTLAPRLKRSDHLPTTIESYGSSTSLLGS